MLLLLVIGSMFSSLLVSSFMIAPQHVYALTYDSKEIKEAKRESDKEALAKDKADGKAVDEGTTQPTHTEKEIKKYLAQNDINWVNKNISKNFTAYYQSGSLTDLGLSSAHLVASLFMSLNLYIIYPLFDTALSKMFDLTNITQGINDIFSNVQQFTKQTWAGEVFKQLLYTAFGLGLVWVFIQSVKSGAGLKAILSVLLVAIIGSAWISAGGTVLTKVNEFKSTAQTAMFTETNSQTQQYTGVDTFEKSIRKTFFEKAVIRPYTLVNFGTTNLDASEKDGSYRLIGGKADSDVIDALAKSNDYLSKDGGEEWYQASVGLMAPIMSLAYGIPLLMIGVFNLILQLGAILLYYLSPFTVLLSLLPRFSNSALKTGLSALGLLFAKIGLLFGIMFVSWVGTVTDTIVPVTGSASALLNSIVYIVLMVLLWKNKSFLVQTVTGSSMANQALNKIQLTQAGQRAMQASSEMFNSSKHGLENIKGFSGRHAKDKDEHKSKDKDEDYDENHDRRGNAPDEQEMSELEEQRRQERAERLADETERQRQRDDDEQDVDYNTDRSADEDYTDRRGYGDDDDLPTYKRTPYLIRDKVPEDNHGNGSNEPDRSFNRGRVLDDESSEKLAEKRREARSQILKPSAKPAKPKSMSVDDDKLQHRNFDEAVHHQEQITQDEEKELDKEL
ncbi:CD3337/EF1877 family mobilome membrane protein [Leuconostoc mesenteroides]|uniref:CD3337/EF1877 family mobilome membrane protein n=1 Tax=Leuconostoc mesenteroides TaxID=1245 RepID=UPI003BB1572F